MSLLYMCWIVSSILNLLAFEMKMMSYNIATHFSSELSSCLLQPLDTVTSDNTPHPLGGEDHALSVEVKGKMYSIVDQ